MISIFDIFKIGLGPSSSHTVGPMKAAAAFAERLVQQGLAAQTERIAIEVYGSLALTGQGHGTFDALLLGLEGSLPEEIDLAAIAERLSRIRARQQLQLGARTITFNVERDLHILGGESLPKHPNGLRFHAYASDGLELCAQVYYSVGGGFIVTDETFGQEAAAAAEVPYPFHSAAELLAQCRREQLNIAEVVLVNEMALSGDGEDKVRARVAAVSEAMEACIKRGLGSTACCQAA